MGLFDCSAVEPGQAGDHLDIRGQRSAFPLGTAVDGRSMRFLVDADVPSRICPDLRAAGHDAVHADEIELTGGDNHALIARARDEHRVILSRNNDLERQLRSGE